MCSDYNGLIGTAVVGTEFYKFWLKVNTGRPYWAIDISKLTQTNLRINSSDCGYQNHLS